MTDTSFDTATRIGADQIRVIDKALDDEDTSMLAGVDERNYCVYLVDGDRVFDIHFTQLEAAIAALQAFLPRANDALWRHEERIEELLRKQEQK